jgi:hypothetical protein
MKTNVVLLAALITGQAHHATATPKNFPDLASEERCPTLVVPTGVNPSLFFNSDCSSVFILPNNKGQVTFKRPLVSQALTPGFCNLVAETSLDYSTNKKTTRALREVVQELARKAVNATPEERTNIDASIAAKVAQIKELDELINEDVAAISKIDGMLFNARYDLRWEEDINRLSSANMSTVSGVAFRPAFIIDGMLSVGSASGAPGQKTDSDGKGVFTLPLVNRVVAAGERIERASDKDTILVKSKGSSEISVSLTPAGACKVFQDSKTGEYRIDARNVEAGAIASAVAVEYTYSVPMLTRWKYEALASHKEIFNMFKEHILEKGKIESNPFSSVVLDDNTSQAGSVKRNDFYKHIVSLNKKDAFYFTWTEAPGARIPRSISEGSRKMVYENIALAIKNEVQNRIFDDAMIDLVEHGILTAKVDAKEVDPETHKKTVFANRTCSDVRDSFGIVKYGESCHDNYREVSYYYYGKSTAKETYNFDLIGSSSEVVNVGQPVNIFYTSSFSDAKLEL